ncbi:MAG: TonB-dependent receptor [Bacteroidaceae bacterium]|nr:TonB-dependent receptor [Bacteroidaceae bacterium]
MKRLYFIIALISTHLFPVFAQQGTDELSVYLDTVDIMAASNSQSVRTMSDGSVRLNLDMLDKLPKIMGNADPISYSRMLPGVQTSGEYNGGLHINGSENSHNTISVLDVPLYNVNHLLGFFSTFIPTHYSSMSLYKTPQSAGAPNRLGGELLFLPDSETGDRVQGDISTGLISSQGTVKVPIGKKSLLTASLRDSYINLLYSAWLKVDGTALNYSFFDSNVTWSYKPNDFNTILADAYWGQDKATLSESDFGADMRCRWGNDAESLHWIHDGLNGFTMKHTLYHSSYSNAFNAWYQDISMSLPSGIEDYGYKGALGWKGFTLGADAQYHTMTLQSPVISGTYNGTDMEVIDKVSSEYAVYADYNWNVVDNLHVKLGVRGSMFQSGDQDYKAIDPSVNIVYFGDRDKWNISLNLAQRHQYLFQTGLTGSGLPTEFWMPADGDFNPQSMRGVTLSGMVNLADGQYTLNSSVYFKRLYNQVEYYGSMMDFLTSDYSVYDHLICGDGYNYGLDLMLTKNTGRLTGWVSYSFGRALRRFDREGMDGLYPASHERLHELDMVAVYKTGGRWEPSMTLVAAGGTPFTAPEYFYMLNRNVFIKYGEFNGSRLNPYIRLDLSVNHDLKLKNDRFIKSHGLNFSVYNALCRGNDLGYRLKIYKDKIYYHHVSFLTWALASISYYCKF